MKYIDLFAGVGGFRYGIERMCSKNQGQPKGVSTGNKKRQSNKQLNKSNQGFTCVYSNEWDKYANSVYRRHYEECDNRDIREVKATEIPDFDLLMGGFPCQSFSIAGKRGGFNDTRGTLFFEIARILRAKRPKYLLLENVKGLLSSKTPLTFDTFLVIMGEEVSLKSTRACTDFVPIKSWEILSTNLATYLKKIGGESGLQKKLKSLVIQQKQITKKLKSSNTGQIPLYECKEEDWDLLLNQLSFTDSLKAKDISILEKIMAINADAVLKLRKNLGVSLNPTKLSTTLTELKLTTDQKTYMSAIQELSIILFIIRQWTLSTSLWGKIKLLSKKENIYYVKTTLLSIRQSNNHQ